MIKGGIGIHTDAAEFQTVSVESNCVSDSSWPFALLQKWLVTAAPMAKTSVNARNTVLFLASFLPRAAMNRDESKNRKMKTENASCRMVVTFQSIAEAHMRDATQTLGRPGADKHNVRPYNP